MTSWESMITVGRIIRPHGNKGAVVVKPETDFAEDRFREGVELSWKREASAGIEQVRIVSSREFRGRWVVMFEGVVTMNDAETLRDVELRVPEAALHQLGPGAHYVHELEGCEVGTAAGASIGHVVRVDFGSSTPLLVVKGEGDGEILIPLVDGICRSVDPASKRIVVELPEGLLDLNR